MPTTDSSRRTSPQHRAHPWHGISPFIHTLTPQGPGDDTGLAPQVVRCFIEMVPQHDVKVEIDKESGYLIVDRPQKFTNFLPCLYGFIPQTYCYNHVAQHTAQALGEDSWAGDQDPLDICVLTDRQIANGDILVDARIVGGLRMLDSGEADDKIIAVLLDDAVYGHIEDVTQIPPRVLAKLHHYFLTYKELPSVEKKPKVSITHTYNNEEARKIIALARRDYHEQFSGA